MDSRALMALVVLSGQLGCGFAPSGGASPGDGDGADAPDAARPSSDSGSGGIGGVRDDANVAGIEPCAPADGLVACYQFESTLDDASAAGNDLSGSGYDFDAGSAGLALAMSSGSSIAPINDDSLDFDQELTIEAWIASSATQQNWFIDHDNQWGLEVQDDGDIMCLIILREDDETNTVTATGGLAVNGAWTHVACTYDGSTLVLYQEGTEANNAGASGSIDTDPSGGFAVGRDAPDGNSFTGLIDTVRIWSRARTSEEIQCSAAGDC